tara:strand:+ start:156 stop:1301 length:1146 start_codon:yes stop_codon:yes gene_type:complete
MNQSFNLKHASNNSEGKSNLRESNLLTPVRVLEVIEDGIPDNQGAIIFQAIDSINIEPTESPLAYPLNPNIKTIPLKNEIVLLISAPSEESQFSFSTSKLYYTTIVNIWNTPHANPLPNQQQNSGKADLGKDFLELNNVNPLKPFAGDMLIEGRQGQSIRMTGASKNYPYVDDSNKNEPLLIISNGQKEVDSGGDRIVEEVNEDPTSLFLTSNHKINLKNYFSTFNSLLESDKPTNQEQFKGSQFLVNSDRIVLNSKKDSLLFTSNNTLNLGANKVGIDAEEYITLDSKKIFLGELALKKQSPEPVLLGNQTESFLKDILDILQRMAQAMSSAVGAAPVVSLNQAGPAIIPIIRQLNTLINPTGDSSLKSNKVFVDPGNKR